jgi:hypothetical protein
MAKALKREKKLASKWQQMKNLVNSDGVKPWDFLDPNTEYADKDLANERYSICLECPLFNQTTKTCSECGCFMAAKTKLQLASCPVGKW